MDDAFIAVLAASGKIAKSIHIPVQSGSDRILKGMGRGYDSAFIAGVVKNLKKRIPAIGIGMDIMAGFPGEDEAAFDETCAFIEALDISYLHVFPYSERPGTRASAFGGKVAESVKRRRVKKLKVIDAGKREAFSRRHLGERVCIIPEAKMYAGRFMRGFSDNYLPVYIPYEKTLENNLVDVTITDMQDSRLIGGSHVFVAGDFLIAAAVVIDKLLSAYMLVVIVRALLSWVRPDPYNPIVRFINGLVDPVTYRISRIIPTRIGMVDISPIILIALIWFAQSFLVRVIMDAGARLR